MLADDLRHVLYSLDVAGARRLWCSISPAPQPATDDEILATLHLARTQSRAVRFRQRAYSHYWLLDHGLPSGLPDQLRPRAERLYPVVVEGVGVGAMISRPYSSLLQRAAIDAIQDVYANEGAHPPVSLVKARIDEARRNERRKLWLPSEE